MAARSFAFFLCAAFLTASCARDPEDAARRFMARGDDFARTGRDDAALIEYRNAVREWPAGTEAHQKLGDAYQRLGRLDEAYEAYADASAIVDGKPLPQDEPALRAIIERRPDLVPARMALADLLLKRQSTAEAEEQLLAASAAEPTNELANRSLAALYLANGRKRDAERCLNVAAAREPNRYRSRLALADFLISEKRYAEARAALEPADRNAPNDRDVELRLAAIDYEEGHADRAEQAVSKLLETNATAQAWTLRAQFLFREQKLNEALAAAREALELDRELVPAQNIIEDIRREQLWAAKKK